MEVANKRNMIVGSCLLLALAPVVCQNHSLMVRGMSDAGEM